MGQRFATSAQEIQLDPRKEAAEAFARDLAALQAQVRKESSQVEFAHGTYSQAQYAAASEKLLSEAVKGASLLHAKWKSNPYVEVEGFNVALGLTTLVEVNVSFRFK